jgi:hypothetical protein
MPKFDITISYSKTIEAADEDAAKETLRQIEAYSNLDTEHGPFSSLDVYTEVEEIKN